MASQTVAARFEPIRIALNKWFDDRRAAHYVATVQISESGGSNRRSVRTEPNRNRTDVRFGSVPVRLDLVRFGSVPVRFDLVRFGSVPVQFDLVRFGSVPVRFAKKL